ncbi:protein of unknown function [Kyrpidia spormannii]|uniref:Uncharacterized protein n=1 Tax=Kyrpidia spormannii TaxID=2055160 RepID=A0A6F9EDQ2_9BACL|nr:protein of unknown function [Kyrpidia spormannii]
MRGWLSCDPNESAGNASTSRGILAQDTRDHIILFTFYICRTMEKDSHRRLRGCGTSPRPFT